MLSYEQIAEKTGTTVEQVRHAMEMAERFELVSTKTVDGKGHFSQTVVAVTEEYWGVVRDGFDGCPKHVRQGATRGTGRTRQEAVIDALTLR